MQQYRVAVLRGGPSEEYDVSLRTGARVLEALDRELYEPLDVVITKSGEWLLKGRTRAPQEIIGSIDLAFIALHGVYGEDGAVQHLLDTMNVPYTGSAAFPSAIALKKAITKEKLANAGVCMPRHMLVGSSAQANTEGLVESISELFGPRYVVKPINGGSSIGTHIANNTQELYVVLGKMLSQYEQVLVEEFIDGREATCGVINNFRGQQLYVLPVVEIIPQSDTLFFNYEAKYNGKTEEICPGHFSREEKDELERVAKLAHETLGLSQYSRSDFIVARDGIYFLEVNALPGLTSECPLPKALDAVGCTCKDFVQHLIADALETKNRR
ncbi:MAG: D-alanine--D-alanine ligase [Patescibacteria group bacterium]|nr:D-alanine--D-alanine ligase [Patescibacteria group bacterium]